MDDVLNEAAPALVMEQWLPAPPERVWRALLDPALRERWLPAADLADPQPCLCEDGSWASACAMRSPTSAQSGVFPAARG